MNAKELFDAIAKMERVIVSKEEDGTRFVLLHSQGWGTAVIKLVGGTNLMLTDCNGTRWLKALGGVNDTLERFGYPAIAMQPKTEELVDLSLAELFAFSDEIGDKYLTDEEIAERDRELAEAFALIDEAIAQ